MALKTKANVGGRHISDQDLCEREPTGQLSLPVREISGGEGIALGFRQAMISVGDKGGVATGAGCGTDFIILNWNGRQAFIRGSEILKAWVATFCPEDAARLEW